MNLKIVLSIFCILLITTCYINDDSFKSVYPCLPPADLKVKDIANTSAKLYWGKEITAIKYRVEYRPISSLEYIYFDVSDTTAFLPALYPGYTYIARVKSICQWYDNGTFLGGTSSPTDTIMFNTINSTGSCVDMFEPNNTFSVSKPATLGQPMLGKISPPIYISNRKGSYILYDEDWFKFSTTSTKTNVRVILYNLPLNYDCELYKGAKGVLNKGSYNAGAINDTIIINASKLDKYAIRVFSAPTLYSDNQCYSILIDIY